jgi:hypothetical protein
MSMVDEVSGRLDLRDPAHPAQRLRALRPAFTADGRVLFVNMQDAGLTFAITSSWEEYPS